MSADDRMLSLIRHVYSAAADESRWPAVLERLSDEYGGSVAGFLYRTGIEGRVRSAQLVRVDPTVQRRMQTHYASRNPWTRLSQPLYRPGFIYTPEPVLPLSALRRTDFYDGILRPAGVDHCFGACVFRHGDDVLSFTVLRSARHGPYQERELAKVREILPHLVRAVQVNQRLAGLRRARAELADGLEQLRHGVVVVNARGRVVFANRAARDIVAMRDGLSINADGLVACVPAERVRLRVLLDDAVHTAAGEGFGSGGTMTVTRPSLKRPFLVVVAPLPRAVDHEQASGFATVFLSDPEARATTAEEITRRLYGFSASEMRVARSFAASGDLAQVANDLRISRETVRWHLRHLYAKTSTHRQSALLKCLVEGASRLRLVAPRADAAPIVGEP